jgi:hypothetical protein
MADDTGSNFLDPGQFSRGIQSLLKSEILINEKEVTGFRRAPE